MEGGCEAEEGDDGGELVENQEGRYVGEGCGA